jgi:uroporphyrinogen decarboxylase
MESMSPVERSLNAFDGKPVDRVPCFCAGMESRTANEILGKPLIPSEKLMNLPAFRFLLDRWGKQLTKYLATPTLAKTYEKRNVGQVAMGFDAIWAFYDDTWIITDSKTITLTTGPLFNIISDGYGNVAYMYRGPGIKSPEEYESWPFWPNADEVAHRSYRYFKRFVKKYGEKTCIMGQGFFGGLQETLNYAFGIDRAPIWIRMHADYVNRFLDMMEEITIKVHTALIDAGVPVICHADDFAFKTGPFMNPKMIEALFGNRYRRIIKNVKDRGARFLLHSCGDNTLLFDLFISWGVDGLHAYESTSNVDIYKEKKLHGSQVTMLGNVGIDYLLTERSQDEEIVENVKELIKKLGPGGRYILGPTFSSDGIPANKLRVMLDTVKEFGHYPINI